MITNKAIRALFVLIAVLTGVILYRVFVQDHLFKATSPTKTEISETATTDVAVVKGWGYTHVARVAISKALEKKAQDLTPERKIYAEDWLQKKIAGKMLKPGQTVSIENIKVEEAISLANNLSPAKADNLKKYADKVNWSRW